MEPTIIRVGAAIEVIRKRIRQFREKSEQIGEQNTKAALIEPLLAALGWDLQEIDEVHREYKRKPQDNPVDYALFLNRTECLLIEAKSLEKDLADRKWISQNISYAAVVGVKWCVLTNGDEYRIYNSHAEVEVDEKLFRKVSVSASDSRFLVDTISLLSKDEMRGSLLDEMWRAHFIDRKVRLAFDGLLSDENGAFIKAICKQASGVTATEARASLKRAKITIDFPIPARPSLSAVFVHQTERISALASAVPPNEIESARKARRNIPADTGVNLLGMIAAGCFHPPLELERTYKGVRLTASVQPDGSVLFGGNTWKSLSAAGGSARRSVLGTPDEPLPATNGWTFWQFREPKTDALREMDFLRQKFLASNE